MSVSLENEKNCGNTSKLQEVCRPTVGRLTADRLPTVGRQSTDKIVWELFFTFTQTFMIFPIIPIETRIFFSLFQRVLREKERKKTFIFQLSKRRMLFTRATIALASRARSVFPFSYCPGFNARFLKYCFRSLKSTGRKTAN